MIKCHYCGGKMAADVELTGGCIGHREGEYCYCASKDVAVTFCCTGLKCKGKLIIPSLGDQYSLARWLTDHYKLDGTEYQPNKKDRWR